MIYVLNILTLLVAIELSIKLYKEKYYLLACTGSIMCGFAFHFYEANAAKNSGKCEVLNVNGMLDWVREVDKCIDYSDGSMVFAQALIVAGFTALVVKALLFLFPPRS